MEVEELTEYWKTMELEVLVEPEQLEQQQVVVVAVQEEQRLETRGRWGMRKEELREAARAAWADAMQMFRR